MKRMTFSPSRIPLAVLVGVAAMVVWFFEGEQSKILAGQGNFIGGGPARLDSEDVLKARGGSPVQLAQSFVGTVAVS